MTRFSLSVASALLTAAVTARAQVGIELTLTVNTNDQTWNLYGAVIDPDNQTLGLHGFKLDVRGMGGMRVTDSWLATPMGTEFDRSSFLFFEKGFVVGLSDGSNGLGISAYQADVTRLSPLGTGRTNILPGVGKVAFTEDNVDLPPIKVDMPVLLASGTYEGTGGALTATTTASMVTLLPKTMPEAEDRPTPFTTSHPAAVHGNALVPAGEIWKTSSVRTGKLTVNGEVDIDSSANGGNTSLVNRLDIAGQGKLNLSDNALIVDYDASGSPIRSLRDRVAAAYAQGQWTGSGITSSAANAAASAIGYAESAAVLGTGGGTFGGEQVDGSAVLFQVTRYGDANLDGTVTIADFGALRGHANQSDQLWHTGDFDYDGFVQFSDFEKLKGNFGQTAAERPGAQADRSVAAASPAAAAESGVHLMVNLATGQGWLIGSDGNVSLSGYEVVSDSGALNPGGFVGLGQEQEDWARLIGTDGYLAEGSYSSSLAVGAEGVRLGRIFDLSGQQDLRFTWVDAQGQTFSGPVNYVVPEPATLWLASLAGLWLIGRRSQRSLAL